MRAYRPNWIFPAPAAPLTLPGFGGPSQTGPFYKRISSKSDLSGSGGFRRVIFRGFGGPSQTGHFYKRISSKSELSRSGSLRVSLRGFRQPLKRTIYIREYRPNRTFPAPAAPGSHFEVSTDPLKRTISIREYRPNRTFPPPAASGSYFEVSADPLRWCFLAMHGPTICVSCNSVYAIYADTKHVLYIHIYIYIYIYVYSFIYRDILVLYVNLHV